MRVTQTISIGTLRINSMSNSSIVQIGTSGAVKTRSEEITEVIPQTEANQKLEDKIYKSVKPKLKKEGIPTAQQPINGTGAGGGGSTAQTGTSTGKNGNGSKPITSNGGTAYGDIGTQGDPSNAGQGNGKAGSGSGNGTSTGSGFGTSNGTGSESGGGSGVSNGAVEGTGTRNGKVNGDQRM
ncbi:MAG: spore germination protein GerPB [Tumebacillaceae bacterium]